MTLNLEHEIRDPIHGLVRLTDQEMGLVDSQPFQRLRRIRQLATADLVYPGAVHTRFEHSLGAMHVAHRILDHLDRLSGIDEEDQRIVRLAALLHDIGHGPFSHVSEYLLDKHYDKSKVGEASAAEKIHEKVTVDVINKVDEIASLLTDEERSGITKIIEGGRTRDYRRDIVSSSLDADKMDYLLRDAYFAGVRYGFFDLDKVIDVCRRHDQGSESYLVIQEEGVYAVEQLILAKHYMTQQVYTHRVRMITDLMIVRGLELAIEDGNEEVKKLFSYDGSEEFLDYYLQFNDGRLRTLIMDDFPSRAANLFKRLAERQLYKQVAMIRLDDLDVPDSIARNQLLDLDENDLARLEQKIAQQIQCESWEVIAHKSSIRHPAYQETAGLEQEAIHVLSRDGTPRMLSQFPDLVSLTIPKTERLHVVAPIRAEDATSDTDQLERRVRSLIFEFPGGAS